MKKMVSCSPAAFSIQYIALISVVAVQRLYISRKFIQTTVKEVRCEEKGGVTRDGRNAGSETARLRY